MTFAKLKRDWFVAVARWRAARPKERFVAASDAYATNARYYFTVAKHVHRVEANTIQQMDVVTPAYFHEYARLHQYDDVT